MTVTSRITVHPERSAKISAELFIEHPVYPKSVRVTRAVEVVTKWARARPLYKGKEVVVTAHTLKEKGEDGEGQLFVNGSLVARFSVVQYIKPEPVPALFAVDGEAP